MELLSAREAAALLADALGRPVSPSDVKDAVRRGRLRAQQAPGRWGRLLIADEEVQRLIEEHRRNDRPLSSEEELRARSWEEMPRNMLDVFWRPSRKPRRTGRR